MNDSVHFTSFSCHFILTDTMPPIATISTDKNYTNAKRVVVEFKFSEPCIGKGGLTCVNSSNCDVRVSFQTYSLLRYAISC